MSPDMGKFRIAILLLCAAQLAQAAKVRSLDVRILSTMLAGDEGFGEWGFSALVVADGHKILFDTGAHPDTVLRNLRALKMNLSDVPDAILSHNHLDHTAGLLTLRQEYRKLNPGALVNTHVGKGILLSRPGKNGESNQVIALKRDYEATGGRFVEHASVAEIYPGVWLTGPVIRKYPERNWSGTGRLMLESGVSAEDNLPEDMSLVIDTDLGLVVISGCGHAGIINTLDQARTKIREAPVYAAVGGFHLYQASDETLSWTAGKLKEFGLQKFLGAHCTGIEAVYRLRALIGMTRGSANVGAIGGGFRLDTGLDPGPIAK
jgi:7,8-dihydropterin-6-yl-methyl-4-(beta-D-ribofuranosyl)aminobenzene 5'-phosphate synthase